MDKSTTFKKANYINIETFKKNGSSVKTPVWFVEKDGVLYTRTRSDSGKLKRIHNNPMVKVAPCKMDGTPTGDWVVAHATVLSNERDQEIRELYRSHYGFQIQLLDFFARLRREKWTPIEICLE